MKYVCPICGYVYDEDKGIPEKGIKPGTKWEDLPDDWECPICGASKSAFSPQDGGQASVQGADRSAGQGAGDNVAAPDVDREMSAGEMSVICSNLARGCEKQFLDEESKAFRELADFFASKSAASVSSSVSNDMGGLLNLINNDLSDGFPYANKAAKDAGDRGAQRALVWSEKVSRMLQSLLKRYEKEGDKMLENTGVWVCTVCGFVFIGDNPPDVCPVCKVPSWKFEKITGRAS